MHQGDGFCEGFLLDGLPDLDSVSLGDLQDDLPQLSGYIISRHDDEACQPPSPGDELARWTDPASLPAQLTLHPKPAVQSSCVPQAQPGQPPHASGGSALSLPAWPAVAQPHGSAADSSRRQQQDTLLLRYWQLKHSQQQQQQHSSQPLAAPPSATASGTSTQPQLPLAGGSQAAQLQSQAWQPFPAAAEPGPAQQCPDGRQVCTQPPMAQSQQQQQQQQQLAFLPGTHQDQNQLQPGSQQPAGLQLGASSGSDSARLQQRQCESSGPASAAAGSGPPTQDAGGPQPMDEQERVELARLRSREASRRRRTKAKEHVASLEKENEELRRKVRNLQRVLHLWATQGHVRVEQALEYLQSEAVQQHPIRSIGRQQQQQLGQQQSYHQQPQQQPQQQQPPPQQQ